MTLTLVEEQRISNIEQTVNKMQELVVNTASKQKLERFATLANEANRETRVLVDSLNTKLEELLLLVQSLK